ncbi:dihydrofolate reductase family protein [Pseudonocardia pini]|uniref:dihydrofolate reductase family protein n=1 Tax=Pseudonocardia pini TaxID=2758030 RepID=UPI0015F033A5|nr:dihydrofolate reductase family protein [Pseudonocardia pini]
MGIIKVHEFTTVDGVVDAPMWTMDYAFTDELGDALAEITGSCSGILLGRTTYEMFTPAWSSRTVEDDPGAPFFNESPKYVVTSTLESGEWNNTEILGGYDAAKIKDLKQASPGDLYVSGSATLVRALLADGLVDELHLLVYPVAVGEGIRLFPQGGPRTPLTLLNARQFDNGVTQLTYGPAAT